MQARLGEAPAASVVTGLWNPRLLEWIKGEVIEILRGGLPQGSSRFLASRLTWQPENSVPESSPELKADCLSRSAANDKFLKGKSQTLCEARAALRSRLLSNLARRLRFALANALHLVEQ